MLTSLLPIVYVPQILIHMSLSDSIVQLPPPSFVTKRWVSGDPKLPTPFFSRAPALVLSTKTKQAPSLGDKPVASSNVISCQLKVPGRLVN